MPGRSSLNCSEMREFQRSGYFPHRAHTNLVYSSSSSEYDSHDFVGRTFQSTTFLPLPFCSASSSPSSSSSSYSIIPFTNSRFSSTWTSTNATFPLHPFHQTRKETAPKTKQNQKTKKKPNTIHRHTKSERLPKGNAIDSLPTTSACKMRRRLRSRYSRRICECQQVCWSASALPWVSDYERVRSSEWMKEGSIPLASILQWVWAN